MIKTNNEIREEIKNWKFVGCPTEEKEPFFWRWTEHGLKMLEVYIQELLKVQRTSDLEEIKGLLKEKEIKCKPAHTKTTEGNIMICHQCSMEGGYNLALSDFQDKITSLLK